MSSAASVLGAVLAGGRSSRFGSDKALAQVAGETLLARSVATLAAQCDAVVVVGRDEAPAPTVADRPAPDMGPLGGIAGALHHAATHGYGAVLTCAVDSYGLGPSARSELGEAPAFCVSQPVIGIWPVSALGAVDAILAGEGRHSLRAFVSRIGARAVTLSREPANINTPADLAEIEDSSDGL